MKATQTKTARLTVEIQDRVLARSLLQDWSDRPNVSLTLLRGRVSPDLARFELEVRGASANVTEIVRQSAAWAPSRRGSPCEAGRSV